MSYQQFTTAMQQVAQLEDLIADEGNTDKQISKAEKRLRIRFSRQHREFYKNFGYLAFMGQEIFRIDPDHISEQPFGNAISWVLLDRKKLGLPKEWVLISDFDDGYLIYLDYSSLNAEKEPRVITAVATEDGYADVTVIAEDFGEFLLQLVQMGMEADPE